MKTNKEKGEIPNMKNSFQNINKKNDFNNQTSPIDSKMNQAITSYHPSQNALSKRFMEPTLKIMNLIPENNKEDNKSIKANEYTENSSKKNDRNLEITIKNNKNFDIQKVYF